MVKSSPLVIPLHFRDAPKALSSNRKRNALIHPNCRSAASLCIVGSLNFTDMASDKEQDRELNKADIRAAQSRMPMGLDVAVAMDASLAAPMAHVLYLSECSDKASDTLTR